MQLLKLTIFQTMDKYADNAGHNMGLLQVWPDASRRNSHATSAQNNVPWLHFCQPDHYSKPR